jgi:hypothetical protein
MNLKGEKKWDLEILAHANHAKCTRQLAQIAAKNAKFRSSQQKASLFTAGTAMQNTDHHEGSN